MMLMNTLRKPRTNSLRRQTLALVALIAFGLIATGALALSFVVGALEQTTWGARQIEASANASTFIGGVMREIRLFTSTMSAAESSRNFDEIVTDVSDQYPTISEVVIVNRDGIVRVARAKDETILANAFNIQAAAWFTTAIEGSSYLSDLQFSPQNIPYLIISNPLPSGGAIGLRVAMTHFADAIAGIQYGESGTAYLVDANGQLLAHPDFALVAANTRLGSRVELVSALQRPDSAWSGTYQNFLGRDVLGTSVPVPDTHWIVFTEVDQGEAFSRGRLLLLVSGIAGVLGGAVLLIAIDLLLRQFIFTPLDGLREGTREVIRGNLHHRVMITRNDEIGQLAREFNTMAQSLQEGRDSLNKHAEALRMARDEALTASQAAEENVRLKSEFLNTMSHELRTPLNAIEGFTSILLSGMGVEVSPEVHGMLERIAANSNRLLQLISAMLDLSRIEAGRLDFVPIQLSPAKLVERWRMQVEAQAAVKKLKLETVIAPDFPMVIMGDEDGLTKIAANLLGNAIKFTPQGSVTLRLLWHGTAWSIQVQDTGIGIPTDAREYIFEEFRQVDGSFKRQYGGTGLGLSIVKKVTHLMNGKITLESTLGGGSTFTVTLPVILPEIPAVDDGAGNRASLIALTGKPPVSIAPIAEQQETAYVKNPSGSAH